MRVEISVQSLTKTFPATGRFLRGLTGRPTERIEVLKEINLEVMTGEILGLLGPNGAGKTTLLEILATYLLPTSGWAWVNGHDVANDPFAVRQVVGYCPAGAAGFDVRLSGMQNLEFFALINHIPGSRAGEKVAHLWKLIGLDRFKDLPVSRYSDGMRQRLALGRALLTDPPVLLLDEPTRNLDPEASAFWGRFLREEIAGKHQKTILLVTHNLLEAETICDRIAIMEGGRIVAERKIKETLHRPRRQSRYRVEEESREDL